jgi:hypothetical protein
VPVGMHLVRLRVVNSTRGADLMGRTMSTTLGLDGRMQHKHRRLVCRVDDKGAAFVSNGLLALVSAHNRFSIASLEMIGVVIVSHCCCFNILVFY